MKGCITTRMQIFGDAAQMGTLAEVEKELEEMDAAEAEIAQEEKEEAENEAFQASMAKRKNNKLMKFDAAC